jgi:hypothetical protein
MITLSIFKKLYVVVENLSLTEIFEQIRKGKYRNQVEELRQLLAEGKKNEYDLQKKKLPAFTPCGTFNINRKRLNITNYSRLIILDIDKLSASKLNSIKEIVKNEKYTMAMFESPSGNGLKILVKVSTGIENHLTSFNQVKSHYESILGVEVDPTGKDITRLCFMSWDKDAILNIDARQFPININIALEDDVQKIVQLIEQSRMDITSDYQSWRNIGFAFADAFGETGRNYFHRVSKFNNDYQIEHCNDQYSKCLKAAGTGISIRTFFYMAKSNGIDIKKYERKYPEYFKDDPNDEKLLPEEREKKEKTTGNKFFMAMKYINEHYDIRHNTVSTEYEYKNKEEDHHRILNENDIFINMQLDGLSLSINNLLAILRSEYIEKYNPFAKYFESLPEWDKKTDYIQLLASYVHVGENDRSRFDNHFKKWIVRAVKCALVDSYFNKQAFILVHDKQNSGKSTFCRFICPQKLKDYIAENLSIDKDSRILLTTNIIINLDELSTLSKVEINSLKSLFSKDKINDRLPYDRRNSIIPRRSSFIGSTNQAEFLNDESGSVRWLCFEIEKIDWNYKTNIDIDQVYAQAYSLFQSGWHCDLTAQEIQENEEYNRKFQISTSEKELIDKYFEPGKKEDGNKFMTATDILMFLSMMTENRVRLSAVVIGRSMKMLGYKRDKAGVDRIYGYYVKEKYLKLEN